MVNQQPPNDPPPPNGPPQPPNNPYANIVNMINDPAQNVFNNLNFVNAMGGIMNNVIGNLDPNNLPQIDQNNVDMSLGILSQLDISNIEHLAMNMLNSMSDDQLSSLLDHTTEMMSNNSEIILNIMNQISKSMGGTTQYESLEDMVTPKKKDEKQNFYVSKILITYDKNQKMPEKISGTLKKNIDYGSMFKDIFFEEDIDIFEQYSNVFVYDSFKQILVEKFFGDNQKTCLPFKKYESFE